MTQLEFDLFDDDRGDVVHVMMPNMRYACGGCICGCSGPRGHFVLGTFEWEKVTCPECLALGREALHEAVQAAQRNQA